MICERYFSRSTVTISECLPQNLVTVIVRKQRNNTLVSHSYTKQWDVIFCLLYISHTHDKCNDF